MKILVSCPRCDYYGEIPEEDVCEVKAKYLQMADEDEVDAEEMLMNDHGFIMIDDCENAPDGIEQEWGE